MSTKEPYRQFHPRAKLAIECNTGRVPSNGKYYVLKGGKVIFAFRSLKVATACYQKLVDEMNLPPLVEEKKVTYEQMMADYFAHASNDSILGTSFSSKQKKTGRFDKTK